MSGNAAILSHLYQDYTEPIRDPLWRNIDLSPALTRIVREQPFLKLGRIKQLGPAYHVYPGATHTRLNHSLGVLHLARRILIAILQHDDAPLLSPEGVRAFLCAALLHDLGHFPYAHSLKELPLKQHETLTAELIESPPLAGTIRRHLEIDPALAASIVDRSRPLGEAESEVQFFRNILSGVLDPDKLDYLNRDAYFCGVPYGVQDTDFVISRMRPHAHRGIAVDGQGVIAVEHVLFSKYLMYRSVYWHKTVRIATAMIKKALFTVLRDGALRPEALYGLDDLEFFTMAEHLKSPAAELVKRVADRNFFKIAAEEPFDPERHGSLMDLARRYIHEAEVARELSKLAGRPVPQHDVVIDIPEPITFETDLPIVSGVERELVLESETAFTQPVVQGLAGSLRKVRLIVPSDLLPHASGALALLGGRPA